MFVLRRFGGTSGMSSECGEGGIPRAVLLVELDCFALLSRRFTNVHMATVMGGDPIWPLPILLRSVT